MTDTEIIEALECCKNPIPMCDDCPVGSGDMCFDLLKDYALDLINRQKAEIARLLETSDKQQAEIERKNRILEAYSLKCGTATDKEVFLRKAKSEAIKEFAERLKERRGTHGEIWGSVIDNLVKEMTEGE